MHSFTAIIKKQGVNPYILVPQRISRALNIRGNISVRTSINGKRFRATLTPLGGGRHKLYLNLAMRQATNTTVGDQVYISVVMDRQPRVLPVPAALRHAVQSHPRAKKSWNSLAPSRRKEILSYFSFLKSNEALKRNVAKVLRLLSHDS